MDLGEIGERKTAVFAVIPDNDSSFNFIVGMLYTQLFQQLYYQADSVHGGRLPVHVHFVMDEFANVALPDEFDKLLSTMRSREISVSIIIQNLAQLKALFEKQWESIVGNCDEFLYLGGNEQSTHEYVSKLLGKETIDTNTYGRSRGRNGSYSTNYQLTGRELMTPDEVRMLDNQYALLFIRGERPVQDFKYDILHHPNVRETTDGGAPAFTHGEDTRSIAAMSFVFDPMEVEKAQKFEPQLHDFELLSEEELQEKFDKKEKKEHEKHQSYGKYDFPYDQIIDETTIGQLTGAVRLRILTVASDLYNAGDQALLLKSNVDNEAILVLSDKYPYFDDLESAAKIRKYVKSRNVAQLPEAIQHIIRGKQQQASAYEKTAKEHISSAILEAKVYVSGEMSEIKTSSVKDKIENSLSSLVESVYSKLGYIKKNFDNDMELLQILTNPNKQIMMGGGIAVDNPDAVDEVAQYLDLQGMKMLPTSMGDIQRRFSAIPYGWREIDIAAVICSLISTQKVALQYSGSVIQPTDKHIPDYLRRKTEIDKTLVTQKKKIPEPLNTNARKVLKDYFNTMDLPADDDGLIAYVLLSIISELSTIAKKI